MAKDHRLNVRMIAEEMGLDRNAVHSILTDHLHMRKICAKLVPKNVSVGPKANQFQICQEWHTKSSPCPKKARMSRSRVKTMMIVFFRQPWDCAQKICTSRTQLITPSTKMSWNDFKNRSSESKGTLKTIGCCTTITRQLTLRFQFENFWGRKTFPYFHIVPTVQI